MPLNTKQDLLIIEGILPADNIILTLENLEFNNKSLKDAIASNNSKLESIRKLLGGL